MSSGDLEWKHAGISDVKKYDKVVRIPDRILGRKHEDSVQMFTTEPGYPIHWYFNKNTGIVCIANDRLEDPRNEWHWVHNPNFTDSESYRASIPAPFFSDFTGDTRTKYGLGNPVPEPVRFEQGESRHFIYNTEMEQDQTQSCYLLTEDQFSERFGGSDEWDLGSVPRFS